MSQPSLEVECLDQLREYIKSLGGELVGDWKCRAQVRDYGSRAGSVDTWFTSPEGEVYRSKVAAARGCGLDPSRGTNTKRPKAPRKSSARAAAAAAAANGDGGDEEGKDATAAVGGSEGGDMKDKEGKSAEKSVADGENGNTNATATTTATAATAPANKKKGDKSTAANDAWKWATSNPNAPRPVDLSMQEIGELLMSMPESFDVDDCYEGPLYYKEAQLRHAAKLARAAAQAASAAAAEREAAELAEAKAASLAEAEAKQARRKENAERAAQEVAALIAAVNDKKANSRPSSGEPAEEGDQEKERDEEKKKEEEAKEDEEMPDAALDEDIDGEERKKKQVNYNEQDNEEEEPEEEEEEEEEDEPDLDGGRKRGKSSRRNTRHSLAAAVAAAAAILHDQSGTQLPPAVAAAAADAAGFFGTAGPGNEDGDEFLSSEPGPPPGLDLWGVELEVIRKCFVRVPVRLGRPIEDEPVPLSPTSRDAELTTALLTLFDANGNDINNSANGSGAGGSGRKKNDEEEEEAQAPREGAAGVDHWYTKRFAIDQLTANNGEPSAVHPAGLFYLRHLEEEVQAEERALRRDAEEKAARREAKRLEKQNALGPDGQPRPSLPKPANLSLRGKSIEEVEEALMERLSTYVTDLGGILPDGWRVKASIRQNGANAGGVDAYYYDPTGRRHKSMIRVAEVLGLESTAAVKPKTLASVLGTNGGKRSRSSALENGNAVDAGGAEDAGEAADAANDDEKQQEKQQQQQPTENNGDGNNFSSPQVDGAAAGDNITTTNRESSPPIDGSEEPGSARKTCGACRTCLNPQLKKGCLVNKAAKKSDKPRGSGGGGKGRAAVERRSPSASPTPPPPKKLTARQLAKIERLKREQAEKEAARAKAAAEEEEEEEAFQAAEAAQRAANADTGEEDATGNEIENDDIPAASPAAAAAAPGDGDDLQNETENADAEEDKGTSAAEPTDIVMEEGNEEEKEEKDAPAAGGTSTKGKRSSGGGGGGGSTKTAATQQTESGGGSKRSRAEATAATGGGGGAGGSGDDDDEEDDRGKRPKRDGDDAKNDDGVPYPRRDRKQNKQQDTPGNDEESKKKKEAAKAARREKRKLRDNEVVRNAYDRAYNRLKGQLSRLRQEQALVEAYAADGWRGASREKVKPVAEIKRAKEQIQRCKEVIRECVKVVDEAEGDKAIPAELFDEDGELDLDHIFCAKCHGNESTDDNDIILCDGHCNRAYHVKCLVPPVDPEALPEDEGWLCPSCDRKIDMIDDINDEFGTEYEYDAPWEEVLAPGTLPISPQTAGGGTGDPTSPRAAPVDLSRLDGLLAGADLPSDDEEDEDYAVSGSSDSEGAGGGGGGDDGASDGSGGDGSGGSSDNEDGSDDDDDNSSLVSEDLGGEILDVEMTDAERTAFAQRYAMVETDESDDSAGKLIVHGKRRRTAVDYKALNQEMFGDFGDAETPVAAGLVSEGEDDEEDEGWSPRVQARKVREERAKRKKEEEEESEEEGEDSGEEEEDGGDAAAAEEEEEEQGEEAADEKEDGGGDV